MPVKYVCSRCGDESVLHSSDQPAKEWLTLSLPAGRFDLCPAGQLELLGFLSPTDFPAVTQPAPALTNAVATPADQGDTPQAIDVPETAAPAEPIGPIPEVPSG
jgi:hypothetical protein